MPHAPLFSFEVAAASEGQDLESYLVESQGLGPRAALKRAFQAKNIQLNGRAVPRATALKAGDRIEVHGAPGELFRKEDAEVAPNPGLAFELLLEAPGLLVCNKPAGQAAHPLRPIETATTLNALAARFPETARAFRADKPLEGALVHRLDRGTSGALACARTAAAWRELRDAWRSRALEKIYVAWVHGWLERGGVYEPRLAHDPKARSRMIVAEGAHGEKLASWPTRTSLAPARTVTLANHEPATLALLRIHTGVTHQIRATLSWLGHPVVGDTIYRHRDSQKPKTPASASPLDKATAARFKELERSALAKLEEPLPELLPEGGFFLHALWLQSDDVADLFKGVLAPLPKYFG